MKMFKRFAAALLAGVMVLAMLTACGGNGGGGVDTRTNEQKAEDAYLAVYSGLFGKEYSNDSALQAKAKAFVEDALDENGNLKSGKNVTDTTGMIMIATDESGKPLAITETDLAELQDTNAVKAQGETVRKALKAALVKELKGKYPTASDDDIATLVDKVYDVIVKQVEAIGVGAVTKENGKIYVAVAVKMANATSVSALV